MASCRQPAAPGKPHKKNAGLNPRPAFFRCIVNRSSFSHDNGARGASLNTTLATQTLVEIHRNGFIILHLDYAHGANIDALLITGALIDIDIDFPAHVIHLPYI
jgi:hypothetical protein